MADGLLSVFRHEALKFGLGLFVLEMRRSGPREDRREFRPGVRRAHIDNAHGLDARFGRLDSEQGRGLTILDTAPELPLSGDDQVLVERIGMGRDLNPLAAAGDHREHRLPGRHHPHIVLQLRRILLSGRLFREVPGQHEFGFEHCPACFDPPVKRCRHPAQAGVPDVLLHVGDDLPGIGLVPAPIKVFGDGPELDDEVAGQVLRLDLAALFLPQPDQGGFVVAHDDPGVRAADEVAPLALRGTLLTGHHVASPFRVFVENAAVALDLRDDHK